MTIRNEIKSYIVQAGYTMTDVVDTINKDQGTDTTVQNLSNKLGRGTIRYSEAKEIADVIGYDIVWVKKE